MPGLYADGGGLYLQVGKTGTRSWIYRFTLNGRAREMGLGSETTLTLAKARQAARAARVLRDQGIDPIDDRRAKRAATADDEPHRPTFREEALRYIEDHRAGWKNAKHADQWWSTLKTYAFPVIGRLPVDQVDTDHVFKILTPIWRRKTETAKRVRGRIEAVLGAAATRYRKWWSSGWQNPARWDGHFEHLLPAPSSVTQVEHHPALPYAEMPVFMAELRLQTSLSARALELTILTAARTIETIGAHGNEFNLVAQAWNVPPARMKRKRPHRVPLSDRAFDLARQLCSAAGDGHLFPGDDGEDHISDGAMLALLGRMGYGHVTVHGFRSSFKDWALEETDFEPDLSEVALSHVVKGKTEAAYRRGDLLKKRRALMQAWADYCHTPTTSGVVVPMHGTMAELISISARGHR